MTPHVAAANVVLAAGLIAQAIVTHPAAAFGHGARCLWPRRLPDAALTLADGRQTPLLADDGRGTLLVVGTTGCGATCERTMTTLQRAFARDPDIAHHWQARFVSLAVGQDDPVAAGCFGSYFDPRFVGGMLTPADTRTLIARLGMRVWQEPTVRGPAWRHEARIDVVDPAGRLLATYPGVTPAADLAADLRRYDGLGHRDGWGLAAFR